MAEHWLVPETSEISTPCKFEKMDTPKRPYFKGDTLPETNIAPENGWLEY